MPAKTPPVSLQASHFDPTFRLLFLGDKAYPEVGKGASLSRVRFGSRIGRMKPGSGEFFSEPSNPRQEAVAMATDVICRLLIWMANGRTLESRGLHACAHGYRPERAPANGDAAARTVTDAAQSRATLRAEPLAALTFFNYEPTHFHPEETYPPSMTKECETRARLNPADGGTV